MPTKEKRISVQFSRYFEKMADKTTRLLKQLTNGGVLFDDLMLRFLPRAWQN
jgi:hypothetical protein